MHKNKLKATSEVVVSLKDVSKSFGSATLFDDVSFDLVRGRCTALVGDNCSGKTTLIKIIAGLEDADERTLAVSSGAVISYLPQNISVFADEKAQYSIREFLAEPIPDLYEIAVKLSKLESNLMTCEDAGVRAELEIALEDLKYEFNSKEGWHVYKMLAELNLEAYELGAKIRELSGGEKTRLGLARAFLAEPDVLLLDEPTNYLDIDARIWQPDAGEIKFGNGVVGYLDQEFESFDRTQTVTDWLKQYTIDKTEAFKRLTQAGLNVKDVLPKQIMQLSYGQQRKLQLLDLIIRGCDILLLDEPTNHMDLNSLEEFESVLAEFPGAVIAITHDQYFIENVASSVLRLENGELHMDSKNTLQTGMSIFSEEMESLTLALTSDSPRLAQTNFFQPEKNLQLTVPNHYKLQIDDKDVLFEVQSVAADGDCGYTAFGIMRLQAYQLLVEHVKYSEKIRHLIEPAVQEALRTQAFIEWLQDQDHLTHALEQAYANYLNASNMGGDMPKTVLDELDRAGEDLTILLAYIDFDVKYKQIDHGWSHPSILFALAEIRGIELHIWQKIVQGDLVPDQYYSEHIPALVTQRTDLLFVNGNHFERLEQIANDNLVNSVSTINTFRH